MSPEGPGNAEKICTSVTVVAIGIWPRTAQGLVQERHSERFDSASIPNRKSFRRTFKLSRFTKPHDCIINYQRHENTNSMRAWLPHSETSGNVDVTFFFLDSQRPRCNVEVCHYEKERKNDRSGENYLRSAGCFTFFFFSFFVILPDAAHAIVAMNLTPDFSSAWTTFNGRRCIDSRLNKSDKRERSAGGAIFFFFLAPLRSSNLSPNSCLALPSFVYT